MSELKEAIRVLMEKAKHADVIASELEEGRDGMPDGPGYAELAKNAAAMRTMAYDLRRSARLLDISDSLFDVFGKEQA